MPLTLGLDIGSSSVIGGLLRGTKVVAESPRAFFKSRHSGSAVEVDPDTLLAAVRTAIAGLGPRVREVEAIVFATMGPAWVAMDRQGRPLTAIVTHQDRRSIMEARELEARLGKERHLALCGCRPFPGGISSTSWAWHRRHQPSSLRRADLVGHLNTFLHRQLTGARVIDPSNASFTGLYDTMTLSGWNAELCANLGVDSRLLPEVLDADVIAGHITPAAAASYGLRAGTPVMTGLMDGSAGMIFTGAAVGQLFNVVGSTDVLALCTDRPKPHERLLTRALGVDGKWLQVSTLAALASSIYWARDQFFPEMPVADFQALFRKLSRQGEKAAGSVVFEPYMAGERTSLEQRQGAFTGITLATTRTHLLSAIIEGLTRASAERLPLLEATGTKLLRTVAVSGGSDRLDQLMHRDWKGPWKYRAVTDATMRGLGMLTPKERR
jgi:xylulokinase